MFAQFVAIGDPKDATGETIISHSLDDRLHRDPCLAGPRGHADNPASASPVTMLVTQHGPNIVRDSPLVIMKLWQRIRALYLDKWIPLALPLASPLSRKPQ